MKAGQLCMIVCSTAHLKGRVVKLVHDLGCPAELLYGANLVDNPHRLHCWEVAVADYHGPLLMKEHDGEERLCGHFHQCPVPTKFLVPITPEDPDLFNLFMEDMKQAFVEALAIPAHILFGRSHFSNPPSHPNCRCTPCK